MCLSSSVSYKAAEAITTTVLWWLRLSVLPCGDWWLVHFDLTTCSFASPVGKLTLLRLQSFKPKGWKSRLAIGLHFLH